MGQFTELIQQLRATADELERRDSEISYKGIDLDNPTDEQVAWLRQMGRTAVLREIDARAGRKTGEAVGTGDTPVVPGDDGGDGGEDNGGDESLIPPTPASELKPVDDMTADELKAELAEANEKVSGSKSELQDRVRELRERA